MKKRHQIAKPTLFDLIEHRNSEEFAKVLPSTNGEQQVTKPLPETDLRVIQNRFNDLHEEIYKKGGIKPTNAAIDEVGKLIFLKIHLERCPDYYLQRGSGQGKQFAQIFKPEYMRRQGKQAVRELQDAFQEISTLPDYTAIDKAGEPQTIFPYLEPFRLDHPEIIAIALEILSPLSLFISDFELIDNEQKQWQSFSHQDLLGSAYDIFLRGKYDNAGGLGTYLTPSQIVDCMVKMAFCHISDQQLWAQRGDFQEKTRWQPESGEGELPAFLVGDICCGTGRFLVRAMAEVRQRILTTPDKADIEKLHWLTRMKRYSFYGADQSASSITKARINFLMFGEIHPQLLTVEDSVLDDRVDQLVGKFDLILTNPPFGEGKYETQAGLAKMRRHDLGLELGWSWKAGESAKKRLNRADPALLFLDRNLQLLKPNGLLLLVLPDGILEPAYAYAHHYLLNQAALRAVVSLPKDAFAIAGTTAKTSFICLQKINGPAETRQPIFMAVANHIGYIKKGTVEIPDPQGNDLPPIAAVYEGFIKNGSLQSPDELSQPPMITSVTSLQLRDALTPQTYHPDRLQAQKTVAVMNGRSRQLRDLVFPVKPIVAARTQRTRYFISVLHVDEKSTVDWVAAAAHLPSSKGLRCNPGDIIFSCLNPAKIRVAVIPDDIEGEILCSTEFAVLQAKREEDPYFIALTLKTTTSQRQIIPLARGTSSSRRRIREQDLLTILLPYPDPTTRQRMSGQFREALNRAQSALILNQETLLALERYIHG